MNSLDIPIWHPSPENAPQQMAYDLAYSGMVQQIGYGGMAGGGKTECALGFAGTIFKDSLIVRRTFQQLKKIIQRGNEIYPSNYVSGDKKCWQWDGHKVTLGHMQHEKDWENYQGQPYQFMAFDEAAQFTEPMVRSIGGWLRTADNTQHTVLFLAFNPPTTPEGEWIVQFFAPWIDPNYPGEKAQPGEIRWFVYDSGKDIEVPNGNPIVNDDGITLHPVSRTFISASRHDNPYLGLDYERALSAMPEPLRTMMMNGDFTASMQDDVWQAIPTAWVMQAIERGKNTPKPETSLRAIGCDPSRGGEDETAIAKLYSNWFDDIINYPGGQMISGQAVGDIVLSHMETPCPIYIDSIGIGASAYDYLNSLPNVNVQPVVNSQSSDLYDKNGIYQFGNVRAASYWKLREALDPASGENVCLPDNRQLRIDLTTPKYKIRGGKIYLEAKDDIIKRIGRSPDYGDSVVMAWYSTIAGYTPVII